MDGTKLMESLELLLQQVDEVELRNFEASFDEIEIIQLEEDPRLHVIEVIGMVNDYAQAYREAILAGQQVDMDPFVEQLLFLRQELDMFLSALQQ